MDIQSILNSIINMERVLNRTDSGNKGGLTLKMQILIATKNFNGEISVKEIMDNVKIVKTNLAILCKNMCEQQLLEKVKTGSDGRFIRYRILEKGQREVNNFLAKSEACFNKILSPLEQIKLEAAAKTINEVLN